MQRYMLHVIIVTCYMLSLLHVTCYHWVSGEREDTVLCLWVYSKCSLMSYYFCMILLMTQTFKILFPLKRAKI